MNPTESQQTPDAPQKFTKDGVKEYLLARGATDLMLVDKVAKVIGNISTRTINNYAAKGDLKVLYGFETRKRTYKLDDVVDWLMRNPRYCSSRLGTYRITDETATLIKSVAYKHWRSLVSKIGIDDLVSEVEIRLMRKNVALDSKGNDQDMRDIIMKIMARLYNNVNYRIKTVSIDSFKGGAELFSDTNKLSISKALSGITDKDTLEAIDHFYNGDSDEVTMAALGVSESRLMEIKDNIKETLENYGAI